MSEPATRTTPSGSEAPEPRAVDPIELERRWRPVWEELELFRAGGFGAGPDGGPRPRRYMLDMFPYPSGDLHMGHAEAFGIGDALARFWMLRGYDVLHPIGWDAFGLPAENAAIQRGEDPSIWTYANIEAQAEGFRRLAVSFDWTRRLQTCDPDYYRWTQWLFLRLFERGLAYRKDSPVNWCPRDQTVLANEQVVNGLCERCGAVVTKRDLTQWYFRITDYADRLLEDMVPLEASWPDRVLTMQRNWIGRSAGAMVDFRVGERVVSVFTTRPDTLYGATFFVVAADSPLALELVGDAQRQALLDYRDQVKLLSDIERQALDRPKTGVSLGRTARNPVNGEEVPVWAADYVLADYGTGAIMAVPAHDQRDLDFARTFDLPVRLVVDTGGADPAESGVATTGDGMLVASGPYTGLGRDAAIAAVSADLAARGEGHPAVTYRLRDWLLSRQRYWGAPIPVVHCPECGIVAVPDSELPVLLPPSSQVDLLPKGESPLASAHDWVSVECPRCGGAGRRDTDTMDTFVDSSWYYLRFCSPHDDERPFDPQAVREWLPAAQYVGGIEHAILHLLYSRFVTKVLHDLGMIDFNEPFLALLNQGSVINQGKAMSKSLGNGVDLSAELAAHGVDAVRVTVLFASPPEDDVDWADVSATGSARWLARVLRVADDVAALPARGPDAAAGATTAGATTAGATTAGASAAGATVDRAVAAVADEATRLVEAHRLNVAIARLMELTNALRKGLAAGAPAGSLRAGAEALAVMLSIFAPYTAEEAWARLGHDPRSGDSVNRASWPVADTALLVEETVTCVVQVNGKVRARLEVDPETTEERLRELALAEAGVQRAVGERPVRTVVVRPPRLVNVVV